MALVPDGSGGFTDDGKGWGLDPGIQTGYQTGKGWTNDTLKSAGMTPSQIQDGIANGQIKLAADGTYETLGGANLQDTPFEKMMNMAAQGLAFAPLAPMIGGAAGIGGFSNLTGGPASWFGGSGASAPSALEAGNLSSLAPEWGGTAGAGTGTVGNFNLMDPSTWGGSDFTAPTGGASDIGGGLPGNNGLPVNAGGAFDMGGSAGVFDSAGNPLYTSPAAAGAVGTSAQSALSKILSGSATADDWLNLAGKVAPGVLAMLGSSSQSDAYKELSDKYGQYGLPALGRLEASYQPGFDVGTLPGLQGAMDQSSKSLLAGLSATGGNPYGNPGGLIDANTKVLNGVALPALNNYRAQNLQQAGLGLPQSYGADTAAAQNSGGVYTGLSSALSGALAPQTDLASLLKSLQGLQGLNLGSAPV